MIGDFNGTFPVDSSGLYQTNPNQNRAAYGQQTGYPPYSTRDSAVSGMQRMDPFQGQAPPQRGREFPRVYDMRSLSAALNAARPGCGEIRRILTSSQFRPRLPGLTKLVSRLSREGHWQKGLEVFESLPEMGLTPDTTITNAAISACDRGGQWEKALQIFYNMDQHGLCRDTITYSSVISALSKGRQCNLAIDVFNHMMNANVHPDAVTCCSLISALDKGGMWQIAEQVFISMYAEHPQFQVLLLSMDDALDPQTREKMTNAHANHRRNSAAMFATGGQAAAMMDMSRMHSMPVLAANSRFGPPGFGSRFDSTTTTGQFQSLGVGPGGGGNSNQPMTPPTRTWSRSPPPEATRRASSMQPTGKMQNQIDLAIDQSQGWFNVQEKSRKDVTDVLAAFSLDDVIANVEQSEAAVTNQVPPKVDTISTTQTTEDNETTSIQRTSASSPVVQQSNSPPKLPVSAGPTPFAAMGSASGSAPLSPGPTGSMLSHLATPFSSTSPLESVFSNPQTPGAELNISRALTEIPEAPFLPQTPAAMRAMSVSHEGLSFQTGLTDNSLFGATAAATPTAFGGRTGSSGFFTGPCQMSRASSAPAPSATVRLRTSSISNRKTAPNRVCCNALLAAYARAHPPQWLKALRLLELMWECGGEVCPDIVSYNTVMKACGNGQQLDIAFKVYHNMRMRGLEPSIATFGTLITVASDAQRYDRVIEVWEWLQQSGMELNITCANAFLSALEKEGRWDDALQFFSSLLSANSRVKPNAVTFNIIMSSYQKRSQPDKVVYVFEDMFAAGVEPSIVTYNTLICAYGQMGDWMKAMEVLQLLIATDSNVQPTLATFNQVLAALSEGALNATEPAKPRIAQSAWDVFQHMIASHTVQPDMVSYNTIITALQRVGETQLVRKLVDFMNSVTLESGGRGGGGHDGGSQIVHNA
eukprot:g8727.t1